MKTALFLATLGVTLSARAALADERSSEPTVVASYDAPPECPNAEAFAASVRAELAGRPPSTTRPLQIRVVIAHDARGYSADATAVDDEGHTLERTVQAPTCEELTEIAAALVGLAQTDSHPAGRAGVAQGSPSTPARVVAPGTEADASAPPGNDHFLTFDVSLGYSAFAVGPANAVVQGASQKTTFNPAQGARIGFGVSHAFGWWKPSLEVSAAYYRQSTTTTSTGPTSLAVELAPANGVDIGDRDVLQASVDVCPVRLEYSVLSLLPCATFSMTQTRGNSGNDPELETGLGGSLRLRGTFAHSFFAEALGTAVGVTSSYEPPSSGARMLYALSLGASVQ